MLKTKMNKQSFASQFYSQSGMLFPLRGSRGWGFADHQVGFQETANQSRGCMKGVWSQVGTNGGERRETDQVMIPTARLTDHVTDVREDALNAPSCVFNSVNAAEALMRLAVPRLLCRPALRLSTCMLLTYTCALVVI